MTYRDEHSKNSSHATSFFLQKITKGEKEKKLTWSGIFNSNNITNSLIDWISYSHNTNNEIEKGAVVNKNTIIYKIDNSTSSINLQDSIIQEEVTSSREVNEIFFDLQECSYSPGYLSPADKKFEVILKRTNLNYVINLLNTLSMKCFEDAKIHSYLHFLNLLKNATFHLKFNDLKVYAVLGVAHKNCEVKDLSLSLFESFQFDNIEEVRSAIKILHNVDTENYAWLTEYKDQIIVDLEEDIEENSTGDH